MNEQHKKSNRKNYRQNGKRGNARYEGASRDRDRNTSDSDVRNHTSNDPAWYAGNAQILKDAASLAFSNPLGALVNPPINTEGYTNAERNAMPGIMTLSVLSVPGISKDNSSPINVAARSMYSFVRHANSGHANYDSPDLMLYCLAVDSCYSAWAWMVRAYGTLLNYSRYNRYYARQIIQAMGFDYDDLMEHIADFRAYINTFAFKLGSICIPANMSYLNRHLWQMSRIWVDSNSSKAQTYMYVPATFWKYDEKGSDRGGRLVPMHDFQLEGGYHEVTYNEVREMCDEMIAAILESEDLMIMSGDILKAYGEGAIQKISTIPENIQIVPKYDEAVCSQFQNAISMEGYPTQETLIVAQDPNTGAILFNPKWAVKEEEAIDIKSIYLNLRKDNPEPADVMVATRCSVIPHFTGTEKYLDTCGSDIVIQTQYHMLEMSAGDMICRFWDVPSFRLLDTNTMTPGSAVALVRTLMHAEKFDWHPYTYICYRNKDDVLKYVGVSGDVDNYTQISDYELEKMNICALLSQFGHANMGAFVTGSK